MIGFLNITQKEKKMNKKIKKIIIYTIWLLIPLSFIFIWLPLWEKMEYANIFAIIFLAMIFWIINDCLPDKNSQHNKNAEGEKKE